MMTLPIGTRVKRGPDWKWGDQDHKGDRSPGLGTVTEKDVPFMGFDVFVMWDNGEGFYYNYKTNCKDVVPLGPTKPLKDFL